jgi:large subunit ribosomal protein L22
MEAKAISKTVRISPYKARIVANEIRGIEFPVAVDALRAIPRKASEVILKTLFSAAANAKVVNPEVKEEDLYLKYISIDEGVTLKRFRPRARGRASRIRKRTSHITIVLSDEK